MAKPKTIRPPTPEEIRQALLDRAAEFTKLTGITRTEIGKRAVNDGDFLGRVSREENFGIRLYGCVLKFINDNWPSSSKAKTARPESRTARSSP